MATATVRPISYVQGKSVIRAQGITDEELIAVGFLDAKIRRLRLELEEAVKLRRTFPEIVLQVK
jgi:hypothetical protein